MEKKILSKIVFSALVISISLQLMHTLFGGPTPNRDLSPRLKIGSNFIYQKEIALWKKLYNLGAEPIYSIVEKTIFSEAAKEQNAFFATEEIFARAHKIKEQNPDITLGIATKFAEQELLEGVFEDLLTCLSNKIISASADQLREYHEFSRQIRAGRYTVFDSKEECMKYYNHLIQGDTPELDIQPKWINVENISMQSNIKKIDLPVKLGLFLPTDHEYRVIIHNNQAYLIQLRESRTSTIIDDLDLPQAANNILKAHEFILLYKVGLAPCSEMGKTDVLTLPAYFLSSKQY